MRAGEILEACVYADDLDAAERFYTSVLGMEVIARVEGRHVFFRCGGRVFLVFNPARTREGGGAIPAHGAERKARVARSSPLSYDLGPNNFRLRYPIRPRDVDLSQCKIKQNPGWGSCEGA